MLQIVGRRPLQLAHALGARVVRKPGQELLAGPPGQGQIIQGSIHADQRVQGIRGARVGGVPGLRRSQDVKGFPELQISLGQRPQDLRLVGILLVQVLQQFSRSAHS